MMNERQHASLHSSHNCHHIHHSSFRIHHFLQMSFPRAKKRLGQNFLVDESYARRIVAALAPRAGETVVEIGPGGGALTSLLLETGARVVAVELDRELAPLLRGRFAGREDFKLIEADALGV